MRTRLINLAGMVLLGMLGMGLFQFGGCLYKDLRYLHGARMFSEAK